MGRLDGKHALITGATSGIGLETARQFLAEGAKVAITGRSQDGLDQAKSDLGGDVLTFRNDASDIDGQATLAAELTRVWPAIDILMCNAAVAKLVGIEDMTPELFDSMTATNMKGPYFLIKALLPLFSQTSSIILIGSISASVGHGHSAAYGASKAGMLALAYGFSHEFITRGIRVNGISPGPTATNALKWLGPEMEAMLVEQFSKKVPLKRFGQSVEIAKAAVYLASDESAFTVAQIMRVDGGMSVVDVD